MNEISAREQETAPSAEDLAAGLSHWQVMDIAYIHRHGPLRVCGDQPCAPLRRLVDANVLKFSEIPKPVKTRYLIAASRFHPVLEALYRAGRLTRPEKAT